MKTALLNFFAASADGATIHVGHGLEEGRIKLDGIFRFRDGEFGNRGIELKLQTLQDNRVKDAAFGALPAQDAVSEDKLDALGLTVDAAVKRIKGLEEAHGLARGPFGTSPFVAKGRPATKSGQPRGIRGELYGQSRAIHLVLLAGFDHARQIGRIVPAGL